MDFAAIDYETYYDKEYSLRKMQTDAYIMDGRYQTIGVSIKASKSSEVLWFSGTENHTKEFLQDSVDWSKTIMVAHHALFDGFISTQRFGLKPRMWMDTLAMARATYPWLRSYSLAKLAEFMALGVKGAEVQNATGLRREDFSPQRLAAYGEYCMNDTALCHSMAQVMLAKGYPLFEIALGDMTVRMFTEPSLLGDVPHLQRCYLAEVSRKEQILASCGIDKGDLMSNPKFAALLMGMGVTPPMKISKTTGNETYAFAKTDKGLKALLDHPDPDVGALVAARTGVKSTIAETRARTLVQSALRGPLPVYLNHWGAKVTGRLSGGNKINYQNLPARGAAGALRKGLIAPPGYEVVVGDSSNIELRMIMMLAGETEALAKILAGCDMYCDFASVLFGREITKADKEERFFGKVAMLSLQYGAGAETFADMASIQLGRPVLPDEAQRTVDIYRATYRRIVKLWRYCGRDVLYAITEGRTLTPVDVNGMFLTNDSGFAIPGQMGVTYHQLEQVMGTEWRYESSGNPRKLYGAKVVENLCQHAARQVVMWQTMIVHRRYPVAMSVHDEIVCVVPDAEVGNCKTFMLNALCTAPAWCRGKLPLAGEVESGLSYGDAK
jgi:DNA polymerase